MVLTNGASGQLQWQVRNFARPPESSRGEAGGRADLRRGGLGDADPGRGERIPPESRGVAASKARGGHGGAAMRGRERW